MRIRPRWWGIAGRRAGNALVSALIAAGIVVGMGLVMLNRSTASVRQMQQSASADQSWYLAWSGVSESMARLRWDSTSWKALKSTNLNVDRSLMGGSFTAVTESVGNTMARITSTGTYQGFTRTLIGVVQWQDEDGEPGDTALFGGGNWRFGGNSHIEGNVGSMGDITFAGSASLCGTAYAWGTISPPLPAITAYYKPGCGSGVKDHYEKLQAYSDDLTPPVPSDDPSYSTLVFIHTGDYEFDPKTDDTATFTYYYIDGIATLPNNGNKGITFNRSVKIIATQGIVVDGPVAAAPKQLVKLYSTATWGGGDPCPVLSGTGNANDVGKTLTMWFDRKEHHDIVVWAPQGMVYFGGSMSGGSTAGVYGKIFAKCVQTSDNWNFYPGSEKPDPGATIGSTLQLTALYEP